MTIKIVVCYCCSFTEVLVAAVSVVPNENLGVPGDRLCCCSRSWHYLLLVSAVVVAVAAVLICYNNLL